MVVGVAQRVQQRRVHFGACDKHTCRSRPCHRVRERDSQRFECTCAESESEFVFANHPQVEYAGRTNGAILVRTIQRASYRSMTALQFLRGYSNPMAAMMKTSQRELHDYISEISERAKVRAGSPLPLGTQERGRGANFAIFSRDASRVRLELFDHPEDAMPDWARVVLCESQPAVRPFTLWLSQLRNLDIE